jgi:hypothetical protein
MDRNAVNRALHELYKSPDLQPDDDAETVMYRRGTVEGALLYASLFVPDLIEIDGSVVLKLQLKYPDEQFREAKMKTALPLEEFEASYNWIELPFLFDHSEASDDQDRVLAEVVAEAWRGRLKLLFPERKFVVELILPEVTGSVLGVGFREVRK